MSKGKAVNLSKPNEQTIETPDPKIVLFQLVLPQQCTFLCLSIDSRNNRLDIGVIKRA